jgi:hypothetical protein
MQTLRKVLVLLLCSTIITWGQGVSEKVAMRISGHVTRSVFDRYDIGSEDDLVDAAKKLESRRSQSVSSAQNSASENPQIGRKLVTGKEASAERSVTHL